MQEYEDDFMVRFTHDTTAIEGNTMTMKETRELILHDKTPGGKELREVYEQTNSKKVFSSAIICDIIKTNIVQKTQQGCINLLHHFMLFFRLALKIVYK